MVIKIYKGIGPERLILVKLKLPSAKYLIAYAREVIPFWSMVKEGDVITGSEAVRRSNGKYCWLFKSWNGVNIAGRSILIHDVGINGRYKFSRNCLIPIRSVEDVSIKSMDTIIGQGIDYTKIRADLKAMQKIFVERVQHAVV